MPRKKKGGNRGESPDKFPSFSSQGGGQSGGVLSHYGTMQPPPSQTSWVDVARQGIGNNQNPAQIEQERTFLQVQEMFKGKVDADVIYMVLSESHWKVDEAVEKLVQISPESDGEREASHQQSSHQYQVANQNILMQQQQAGYDNLRSRLPSGNSTDIASQLPLLSPKTPAPITYPENFPSPIQQHVQPGMKALNSYAMNYSHAQSDIPFKSPFSQVTNNPSFQHAPLMAPVSQVATHNMYNTFNVIAPNYSQQSPANQSINSNAGISIGQGTEFSNFVDTSSHQMSVQFDRNIMSKHDTFHSHDLSSKASFVTVAKTQSETSVLSPSVGKQGMESHRENIGKMGVTQSEQKIIAKKRGRKTTMSLNPEEREALENLIGDVIMGGIGDGVIDSGESSTSSTESDEETKQQTENSSSDAQKEEYTKTIESKSDTPLTPTKKDGKEGQKQKVNKEKQKGFEQGQKVYPPQLKVAVKHMKNLPPRFLRKIQPNKDEKQETESDVKTKSMREKTIPEVVEPKEVKPEVKKREDQQFFNTKERAMRSKEERMIESKKKVRGMLLEGLDHYLEQSVDSDEKKQSEDHASDKELSHPSNKNETLTEHFSHSAPSSAQVSPNAHLNRTPQKNTVDLCPVDPAIKAQGPTIVPQIRPNLPVHQPIIQTPRFIGQPAPNMIMNRPPAPVYLQTAAVNCEELEREMFMAGDSKDQTVLVSQSSNINPGMNSSIHQNFQQLTVSSLPKGTHLMQNHHYHQLQQLQNKSQFSVDAPEFIPRTFTPGGNSGGPHGIQPEILTPPQIQQPMPMNVSKPMGRLSPHVVPAVSSIAGNVLSPELMVSAAHPTPPTVGRNSPIPGGPAFILPKVPPPNVASPHTATMPPPPPGAPPPGAPPGPGVGLVYAPVATPYPHHQFRPAGYPQYQLQGPFLVQAWPGGRKTHTNQLHPSHPASHQKISGMGIRGRPGSTSKGSYLHNHIGATQKLPHRGQHEMSPQQAKEKVETLMKQGKKVLVILRGLPGSGKSTIAKEVKGCGEILTTDDFFSKNGVYEYDLAQLSEAHEWNQQRAKEAIEKMCNPIVIDNTNTQSWEMKPYVGLALKYDYHIEIIEPSTTWKFKVKELAQKNSHNVLVETLQKMLERYEKHVTIERIMGQYDSKKKEDGEKADDPDGEKRTPRRRRRRRRRRKKKTATEANSDSDKAEDERSSDEEQISSKPDPMMSSIISTDTTENELERSLPENLDKSLDNDLSNKRSMKVSSSSLESDDVGQLVSGGPFSKEPYEEIIEEDHAESEDYANKNPIDQSNYDENLSISEGYPGNIIERELSLEGNKITHHVKSALQYELGMLIREQIIDNLVTEEVAKLPEGSFDRLSLNGNGITIGKDLVRQISEKLDSEEKHLLIEEEKAKEDWEFVEPEDIYEIDKVSNIENKEDNIRDNDDHQNVETPEIEGVSIDNHDLPQNKPESDFVSNQTVSMNINVTTSKDDKQSKKEIEAAEKQYWNSSSTHLDRYTVQVENNISSVELGSKDDAEDSNIIESDLNHKSLTSSILLCDDKPKEQRSPKNTDKASIKSEDRQDNDPSDVIENTTHEAVGVKENNLLDSKMKDKLLASDWSIPSYKSSQSVAMVESSVVDEKLNNIICRDAETNTVGSDFSAIQKLLQVPSDENPVSNFKIKVAVVRVINTETNSKEGSPSRPMVKLALDKGCMTEDTEEEIEGLDFLKACFPIVPLEDLEDIFVKCNQDTEWAVNILLDSGYECMDLVSNNNEQEGENETVNSPQNITTAEKQSNNVDVIKMVSVSEISQHKKTDNDSQQSLETVSTCISHDDKEVVVLQQQTEPLPLFDLCHCIIVQCKLDVSEKVLLEQVSNQNQRRTKIIEEFISLKEESNYVCSSPGSLGNSNSNSSLNTSGNIKNAIEDIAETVFPNTKDITTAFSLTENNEVGICNEKPLDKKEKSVIPDHTSYLHMNGDKEELHDTFGQDVSFNLYEPPQFENNDLTLNLSTELSTQLIEEFGPVGFHISPESLSKSDLQVRISRRYAKEIHRRWACTLQEKFTLEEAAILKMMKEDEELARKLQAEEDYASAFSMSMLSKVNKESSVSSSTSPKRPPPIVGLGGGTINGTSLSTAANMNLMHPTPSLKEIMQEEYALELSMKDYENKTFGDQENCISTKLKRQKLHKTFPKIDSSALDEIFSANGYSLEASVRVIEGTFGGSNRDTSAVTDKPLAEYEKNFINSSSNASKDQMWLGMDDETDGKYGGHLYQSFDDPTYQNYRAEASLQYKLRHECFQKAQEAYRRGMKAVASFYSQQGHLHTEKLKEANKRAAEKIIEYRHKQLTNPNTIDLHGLHVDEALHVLRQEIQNRESEMQLSLDKRMRHLYVVTGQGKHSRRGQAKIKPAVMDFLKKHKYLYTEPQGGLVRVSLKYREN